MLLHKQRTMQEPQQWRQTFVAASRCSADRYREQQHIAEQKCPGFPHAPAPKVQHNDTVKRTHGYMIYGKMLSLRPPFSPPPDSPPAASPPRQCRYAATNDIDKRQRLHRLQNSSTRYAEYRVHQERTALIPRRRQRLRTDCRRRAAAAARFRSTAPRARCRHVTRRWIRLFVALLYREGVSVYRTSFLAIAPPPVVADEDTGTAA